MGLHKIMNIELQRAIYRSAQKIENFQIGGCKIGFSDAEKRINRWVNNFDLLLSDPSVLIAILDNIEFIPDDEILNECLRFQKRNLNLSEKKTFYTCLGAETESSARIMRQLNNHPQFAPNISDLLKLIKDSWVNKPAIVFIDDFLNSGGQISKIMETWCGRNLTVATGSNNALSYNKRGHLSLSDLGLLRRCELHFLFYYGMAKGIEKAEQKLKSLEFIGNFHVIKTYSDETGFFGTQDDLSHIRAELPVKVSSNSIFSGVPCNKLSKLLKVCEDAGYELLKYNKPGWDEVRYGERILGYGNSAKLFISQINVPTCTLTCLWHGGDICIDCKKIKWEPLLSRTEKKIGGTEYRDISTPEQKSVPVIDINTDILHELKKNKLDSKPDASPPLDITLFNVLPEPVCDLDLGIWKDVTNSYTDLFNPDILDFTGIGDGKATWVKELNPEIYSGINSCMEYRLKGDVFPVKIKSIHMTTFGNLISFAGVRFQFKSSNISLKNAVDINFYLPINNKTSNGNTGLFLKNSKGPVLFGSFFPCLLALLNEKNKSSKPFPGLDILKGSFREERSRAMTFIREGSGIFNSLQHIVEDSFSLLATFSRPTSVNLRKKGVYKTIKLDIDALISGSKKGAVAFCGNDAGVNKTYLQDHFQKRYYFLYLLVWHIEHLLRISLLRSTPGNVMSQDINSYLDRFKNFPFGDVCQKNYMNEFVFALTQVLPIQKSVLN